MDHPSASTSRAHLPPPLPLNSSTSVRSVPLLGLTAPAVALGENFTLGEMPGEERDLSDIWNVITRAADIVKDGQRLENLCWRIWGSKHPTPHPSLQRRDSTHSITSTQSSASLLTPVHERPPSSLFAVRSNEPSHLTFGAGLKLLVNEENNFKDWVLDAKSRLPPPALNVPDTPTPTPNLEIRLVEPTPVPSRVGSLGGSLSGGLLGTMAMTSQVEDEAGAISVQATSPTKTKKRTKFFVQSSPGKGAATDSPDASPVLPPDDQQLLKSPPPVFRRTSSGSSSGGLVMRGKRDKGKRNVIQPPERRQVSLSTMRGRFHSEKRKAAAIIAQQQEGDGQEEESGWEDDDEGLGEEAAGEGGIVLEPSPAARTASSEPEDGEDADWSDEDDKEGSPKYVDPVQLNSKPRRAGSTNGSNKDLQVLTRKLSRRSSPPTHELRDPPPPPAPTPLTRMSKKARLAAEAERRKIEADLERQRQREFFAKKQIFGQPVSEGLLAGILKRGNSMFDLSKLSEPIPHIRPSPTHVDLTSLRQSPATPPSGSINTMRKPTPQPNLMRSKSVIALPVATGVSVTVSPHGLNMNPANRSSVSSGSSAVDPSRPSTKRKTSSNKQTRFALGPDSAHSASGSDGIKDPRGPLGVELESGSDDEDENYLATSATQRRLEQIQQRRVVRTSAPTPPPTEQAIVIPALSPTSRRRLIITREMSESLRRNLIVERTASTAGSKRPQGSGHQRPPPSKHMSVMPTRPSASDLTRYGQGAPLYRTLSQPALSTDQRADEEDPAAAPSPTPTPPPTGRTQSTGSAIGRPKPNLLTGGFLRPLTRVGGEQGVIGRTQSSAQLSAQGSPLSPTLEAGSGSNGRLVQAPVMVRSLTEGDGKLSERDIKRRELQRRSDKTDTSYRLHGW